MQRRGKCRASPICPQMRVGGSMCKKEHIVILLVTGLDEFRAERRSRQNGVTCVANSCDKTAAIEACIAVRVLLASPRVSNALVSLHSNPSRRLSCHLSLSKYREESGLCIVRCIIRWGKPFLDTRVPQHHVTRVIAAPGCVTGLLLSALVKGAEPLPWARRSQRLPHEFRHA